MAETFEIIFRPKYGKSWIALDIAVDDENHYTISRQSGKPLEPRSLPYAADILRNLARMMEPHYTTKSNPTSRARVLIHDTASAAKKGIDFTVGGD